MTPETSISDIDGRYAWLRLGVSVLLATIGNVGMWAVIVVMPAVQVEFGVLRAEASLPYTVTMIGFAAGNVLVGRAIDRFGYWRPTLATSLLLAAGFLVAAYSTSIYQFALAQGLIGVGASALFGPLIADISHWFVRRRGVAVSAAAAGNYLAGAFWPAVMPGIMAQGGWRFTYVVIAAILVVTMVPLVLLLRRRISIHLSDAASGSRPSQRLEWSPGTLQAVLMVAGLGCCVAMSMPQVHIVAYCADLGYGVARGSEMLSIMLAAGVVSRMASGFLADRIGGVRTLLIGSAMQCLSLLLYLPFDGLASLYIVSLVFGLSQGGIVPCYAIIVREYMPAAQAGQRVGIVIMSTIMGMALGGWMSGWIYDMTGSYAAAFLNGIAWNVLNLSIALLLLFQSGGRTSKPAPA